MMLHQDGIKRDGKCPMSAVRPRPPGGTHEQTTKQDTTGPRSPELSSWSWRTGRRSLQHLETMENVCPLAMQSSDGFGDRVAAIGQEESRVCVLLLVLDDGCHHGGNLIKLLFHRQRCWFLGCRHQAYSLSCNWTCAPPCISSLKLPSRRISPRCRPLSRACSCPWSCGRSRPVRAYSRSIARTILASRSSTRA